MVETIQTSHLAAEVIRQGRDRLSTEQWIRIVEGHQFVPAIREQDPIIEYQADYRLTLGHDVITGQCRSGKIDFVVIADQPSRSLLR